MSFYEALSLVISSVGTLGSVYVGMRQLRQGAPVAQATAAPVVPGLAAPHAAGHAPGPQPTVYAPPPPATAYAPPPQPPAYGQPARSTVYGSAPVRPALRPRPRSVTAASLLLYLAASLQPVVFALYYAISYGIDAEAARNDFESAALTDLIGLGAIGLFSALLGIFVARGSRVAAWTVWAVALLAVPMCGIVSVGLLLQTFAPEEGTAIDGAIAVLIIGYFSLVTVTFVVGAILLLTGRARDFFFKRA